MVGRAQDLRLGERSQFLSLAAAVLEGDLGERLEAAGLVIAGTSPDGSLVEIVELADHPWFVAVQFHPEFKSKPTAAHPLFAGLVSAAVERHAGSAWVAEG